MKTLEVLGRTVSINIEALSKGLCELHNSDPDMKAVLAFGMLDHGLCEMMETEIAKKVKAQYSPEANELFADRINGFIKECNNEIAKGVYKYAAMVV